MLTFGVSARAEDRTFPFGIQAELSAGSGEATVGNTDGTSANYSLLTVKGRALIPIVGDDPSAIFQADLVGGIRYLDLQNTGSIGSEKETANMIGPGGGLQLRLSRFFVGADYSYIFARHYSIGPLSHDLTYTMPELNYYGGFLIPFGQLAIGLSYSKSTATIPHASSGLSKDCAYQDQILWLQFTYSTGASFANFIKLLF